MLRSACGEMIMYSFITLLFIPIPIKFCAWILYLDPNTVALFVYPFKCEKCSFLMALTP